MRRGSSGADIIIADGHVTKMNGDNVRLIDQANWLRRHESPATPRVIEIYAQSYVMERLFVPPATLLNHTATLDAMLTQLDAYVWYHSPVVPVNHEMLRVKIDRLLTEFNMQGLWPFIINTHTHVRWADVRRCLTHGDPTFDNVMIRESTGEIVLVDPIPATLVNPDMWSVDIGKILQSCLGWESARYLDPSQLFTVGPQHLHTTLLKRFDITDNEWAASVFWCVVHLLRTLPYVSDSIRLDVRRMISSATTLL